MSSKPIENDAHAERIAACRESCPYCRTGRFLRRAARPAALTLTAAAIATVLVSLVFNAPIRFRPKWDFRPGSHSVLYPSGARPDNIVLAPGAGGVGVSWRASSFVEDGAVEYREAGGGPVRSLPARVRPLECAELKNDATTHSFSASLTDLRPGVSHSYRVGGGGSGEWSEWFDFTTAPADGDGFSFVFLGDTQMSARSVGRMFRNIESLHPDAAFYALGGDIVEMGEYRNHWDEFLAHAGDVPARKPLVPTLGNHDAAFGRNSLNIYRSYFNLPEDRGNGLPDAVSAYGFSWGPAYFIVLDSNSHLPEQRVWLERELEKASDHVFRVVLFHRPVYNVKHNRFDLDVLGEWAPVFDRYGVDLVLNGHEHSYMRSMKVKAGIPDEDGVVYVVANSSVKHRRNRKIGFAEVQFTKVQTYQVVDISRLEDGRWRLGYGAYAAGDNRLVDSFELFRSSVR